MKAKREIGQVAHHDVGEGDEPQQADGDPGQVLFDCERDSGLGPVRVLSRFAFHGEVHSCFVTAQVARVQGSGSERSSCRSLFTAGPHRPCGRMPSGDALR